MWYIGQVGPGGRKRKKGDGCTMLNVLKFIGGVLVVAYIAFVLKDPPAAGRFTREALLAIANGLGGFFSGLAS